MPPIEQPRNTLLAGPTPLCRLERLSRELGREVWIKRDDLTPVGFGGNKIRKLEFLLDEADEHGADVLLTVGAAQSNHCRAVAAVAAMTGRRCVLVLAGRPTDHATGNLLLDQMWGATVEFVAEGGWPACLERAQVLAGQLRDRGDSPFVIPVGGSTVVGTRGYARAYDEMLEQGVAGTIVTASGSGGTHAGLMAGFSLSDHGPPVVGVQVAQTPEYLSDLAAELCDSLVWEQGGPMRSADGTLLDGYMGHRYGQPTPAGRAAQALMMRTEGIVLDDVYTSKAFAAIVTADERIPAGPVTFLHTGGTPAVFA